MPHPLHDAWSRFDAFLGTLLRSAAPQDMYVVPKYPKSAIAGDWVLMWQDTGAVFRLHLKDDGQFESLEGLGTGQLGGRWNTWDADRCERMLRIRG